MNEFVTVSESKTATAHEIFNMSMTEEQLKKVINKNRHSINIPNESVLLDMIFLVGDLAEESGDYVTANNVRSLANKIDAIDTEKIW